jgi:hypothetical protein
VPVRAALCMKELRRSFRMLASCMRRSFVMAWIALFSASWAGCQPALLRAHIAGAELATVQP